MGTIGVAKIQKKRRNLKKSYPDTFYTLLDVLIVSHMLEILCSYGRNTAQLLMSSELGQFEGTGANFLDISHCTTTIQWSDFNGKYYCFHSISRSSVHRFSSYSTVSKCSPVLSNCKVSAPSDHWWRRYIKFSFWSVEHKSPTHPHHCMGSL